MGTIPDKVAMLSAIAPLVGVGAAVHWLRSRDKAPIEDGWQDAPFADMHRLAESYRPNANGGVRLGAPSQTPAGYLHLFDLDIRKPELADEALSVLRTFWPAIDALPFVISGSGGEGRHFYFTADKPFRSRKLAKSAGFTMVYDRRKERDVKKYDWEIEIFGTGKQAVLPPSIHPDSGLPYKWGRPLPFDLMEMGIGPSIPVAVIESWGISEGPTAEEDDFLTATRAQPMGLSETEIAETLRDLPADWVHDRDQWREVGMALHHEYEGGQAGFDRWTEWSKQSPDKYDAKDQAAVWKSFKGSSRPVRMATLIKAAAVNRLEMAHDEDGSSPVNGYDDLNDLLGDVADDDLLGDTPTSSIAPGASGVSNVEWRSKLQINEDGAFKPSLHNMELIIRNDPRFAGTMAFNEFTQDIVLRTRPGTLSLRRPGPKGTRQLEGDIWRLRDEVNGDLWSDSHDNAVRTLIEAPVRQGGYSITVSDRNLKSAIDLAAHATRFHPVRDYLRGLRWDGHPRLDTLFVDFLGAEDNEYHRAVARLTLLGAVTRVFEPGHKFDFVPILEGVQGKRKSTFIKILSRHWFAELEGDFHDTKGMVEKMQGSWILEIPELQGFSKAEVQTIKGFISRTVDKVRLSYDKRARQFFRQCVFMGSTNDWEYLRDTSGGRRFWPVACTVVEIDTARLEQVIDQVWAEAVATYDAMRAGQSNGILPLYLTDSRAQEVAAFIQESRRVETPEEGLAGEIGAWLDAPVVNQLGFDESDDDPLALPVYRNEVCLIQIWREFLRRETAQYDSRTQQQLSRAMTRIDGWLKCGRGYTEKYGRQRIYKRITPI